MFYFHEADVECNDPWAGLRQLPETGPGYQIVEVVDRSSNTLPPPGEYIVLNCELYAPKNICLSRYFADSYENFKQKLTDAGVIKTFTGYVNQPAQRLKNMNVVLSNYQSATLIVKGFTKNNEQFRRSSAYSNDRRIDFANNSVYPNTYLAPFSDKIFFTSGLALVGRYALPTPFPANYVWIVKVKARLALKAGTVRPAFGQAGGGVEIVLSTDSGNNSVSPPSTLFSW